MTDKQLLLLGALSVDRGPRFDSELIAGGFIDTVNDPVLAMLERCGYIRQWRSYMAGTAYTITPLGQLALDEERLIRVEVDVPPPRVSWIARVWQRLRGWR